MFLRLYGGWGPEEATIVMKMCKVQWDPLNLHIFKYRAWIIPGLSDLGAGSQRLQRRARHQRGAGWVGKNVSN